MFKRSRVGPAVVALTLMGGFVAVGTSSAAAATSSCGASCIDLFSARYGTNTNPAFVLNVIQQHETVGQPTNLARAGSNPGEDFTSSYEGEVSDFYAAGLVAAGLDMLYANLSAFEFQYAPSGVASGLCLGVRATPTSGTLATLQPCGVSAKTLWIMDPIASSNNFVLINGATNSNFSHPQVLSTLLPGLPLFTFSEIMPSGTVVPNQVWGSDFGTLPAS